MKALDRKLVRDLGHMKGQVLTIALVTACGIASYATTKGTYYSLTYARDTYYERYRFPDVFAHLERAPNSLRPRIEAIDGVSVARTRLLQHVNLPIEGFDEPATGYLLSLPAGDDPALGAVSLRSGRMLRPGRPDEVLVLEAFAKAHGLTPGDRLPAVLNGVRRDLRVVGIVLSPEFVFAISPGELIPDPRRFGVLWMDRKVLEAAYDMEGAFNDVVLRLQPGVEKRAVITALNRLLEPFGGTGAYGRDKQLSNNALTGELASLNTLTAVMPLIFLGVAAFLINVVLSRLVQLERPQIAALKAVGYKNREVGLFYLKLVTVVVIAGGLIGIAAGAWLGDLTTGVYTKFFHFPDLRYRIEPRLLGTAVAISALSAVAGALGAVRAVIKLPPAEAMRPEPPAVYRKAWTDRLGLSRLFGQAVRMVLREVERRPLRTLLSSVGIALGVAVLVTGRFGYDSIDWFIHVQFELAQGEDLTVSFAEPVAQDALHEVASLPGVREAEGMRMVAVRFRSGHHSRESTLIGHPAHAELRRVLDQYGTPYPVPAEGIMLTRKLAEILDVGVGQRISVEVLEGERGRHELTVVALVDEVFGLQGHMRLSSLSRMLHEAPRISVALLTVDPLQVHETYRALKRRPGVLGVTSRMEAVEMFKSQTAGQMAVTTLIMTVFASIIAGGVIYNNARVALSTRSRDLASLRVLGFRRSEISAILLGELALQVVLAIPPGLWLGTRLTEGMMSQADPELYRFPVMISPRTYAFAIMITAGAALVSALLVRRRLDHLDLIGVMKTRE